MKYYYYSVFVLIAIIVSGMYLDTPDSRMMALLGGLGLVLVSALEFFKVEIGFFNSLAITDAVITILTFLVVVDGIEILLYMAKLF